MERLRKMSNKIYYKGRGYGLKIVLIKFLSKIKLFLQKKIMSKLKISKLMKRSGNR